jgi:hypothetical protein
MGVAGGLWVCLARRGLGQAGWLGDAVGQLCCVCSSAHTNTHTHTHTHARTHTHTHTHAHSRPPVTVLTSALLVATMERPGSMMSVRPDALTMSRTVSMRSVGVGRMSPLRARAGGAVRACARVGVAWALRLCRLVRVMCMCRRDMQQQPRSMRAAAPCKPHARHASRAPPTTHTTEHTHARVRTHLWP